MKIVYMTGVFDILHKGHLRALRRAKYLGDFLVVGVQDDEGVIEHKGKRPHLTTHERVEQLQELPFIDRVVVYHQTTVETILDINPNIFVHSPSWFADGDRRAVLEEMIEKGVQRVELPYTADISTSEIERRIYDAYEV